MPEAPFQRAICLEIRSLISISPCKRHLKSIPCSCQWCDQQVCGLIRARHRRGSPSVSSHHAVRDLVCGLLLVLSCPIPRLLACRGRNTRSAILALHFNDPLYAFQIYAKLLHTHRRSHVSSSTVHGRHCEAKVGFLRLDPCSHPSGGYLNFLRQDRDGNVSS